MRTLKNFLAILLVKLIKIYDTIFTLKFDFTVAKIS